MRKIRNFNVITTHNLNPLYEAIVEHTKLYSRDSHTSFEVRIINAKEFNSKYLQFYLHYSSVVVQVMISMKVSFCH